MDTKHFCNQCFTDYQNYVCKNVGKREMRECMEDRTMLPINNTSALAIRKHW